MSDDRGHWPWFQQFDRHHSGPNAAVILISIASFLVVAIALFILHRFYFRRLSESSRRRRAVIQILTTRASAAQAIPDRGLDSAALASLPTFAYKKPTPDGPGADCSICIAALQEGEKARLLPSCGHLFHMECIDTWLQFNSTCPVCRSGAEPQDPKPGGGEQAADASPPPSAPVLSDGTSSDHGALPSPKAGVPTSRLSSSFRRILSRERSEKRVQPSRADADAGVDLERQ